MLSYVDHDTQTINEDSDESDSQISKTESQSRADNLDKEAVVRRCSVKKAFLKSSQNSQENTCEI